MHICVTNLHTQDGVADQFIEDIRAVVAQIMINPEKPVEGKVSSFLFSLFMYGIVFILSIHRWQCMVLLKLFQIER